MRVLAITLDLDDTLWPIEPVIQRAEQRLDDWLRTHCPAIAQEYPPAAMRALREFVAGENPHLAHDFTALRKLSLRAAFAPHGYGDDYVEAAFMEFYTARNQVELYADALPGLKRLSAHFPLVSLSNGNADLERIGLSHYFAFSIFSRDHGVAKPAPAIFHAACARLNVPADCVLHVGDDPVHDIAGARAAGLRCAWLNRRDAVWPADTAPDFCVRDLVELSMRIEHLSALA